MDALERIVVALLIVAYWLFLLGAGVFLSTWLMYSMDYVG
jgi:hypothetical protein